MPFKPNYSLQRADRERAKREKNAEKLRRQQEETASRRATLNADGTPSTEEDGKDPA